MKTSDSPGMVVAIILTKISAKGKAYPSLRA
jgi:hypothetical protein